MDYELAKQLKDAGFPYSDQKYPLYIQQEVGVMYTEPCIVPTLSELIAACGNNFYHLLKTGNGFQAIGFDRKDLDPDGDPRHLSKEEKTPEEAVARLWLELKNNK